MTAAQVDAWAPFVLTKRIEDLAALSACDLLAGLEPRQIEAFAQLLEVHEWPAGTDVVSAGEPAEGPMILLAGEATFAPEGGSAVRIGPGGSWAEASLEVDMPQPATVTATTAVRVALLRRTRFATLERLRPEIALPFLRRMISGLVRGTAPPVSSATEGRRRVADAVPSDVGGSLVVAGRIAGRTVALDAEVGSAATIQPVTVRDWEGSEIYRRTAGIVFLEAARRLGQTALELGPSWTSGRAVRGLAEGVDAIQLAASLNEAMERLIREAVSIREEVWLVDDAAAHFAARGWDDAGALLDGWGTSHVRLSVCGETRVPTPGPMLPHAGWLSDVRVLGTGGGLLLDFGDRVRRELVKRPWSTAALEIEAPRYGSDMTLEEQRWLEGLGIVSVGAFNRACVTGAVRDLIDVAEGFHEKNLASLADEVRGREGVRVVAVAGPSSSGKTTFLKRLATQLRVVGLRPVGLSLDDYYVDRERTARDADGEYDFESVEALDRELLDRDLARLLAGEAVQTARYDFPSGRSIPAGGPELRLAPDSVLVLEGIHALNPALLGEATLGKTFKVFIHPATALPFDPLTSLEPSDVRLLRRIVRDRHTRGALAEQNLARWSSVRRGERLHIDPWRRSADRVFDTSLIYEISVLKVFAERYLLEVPRTSPHFPAAARMRRLIAPFVPIYPDRVPQTSILREFIGASGLAF